MPNKFTPMAIIYDFDGTLAPGNLQENSFIPDVGETPNSFWEEVNQRAKNEQADRILMYMYLMLEKAKVAKRKDGKIGVPVRKEDFKKRGESIQFFKGVLDWFERINDYGKTKGVRVEHYIVSSGNAEIIKGTLIAGKFTKIYASRFMFDEHDAAFWPALAVNFTTKTQFLFRINKGAHDPSDDSKINEFVEQSQRPMPFENMVYIGDGETDIPCFRLIKDLGGLSIAVYRPKTKDASKRATKLMQDGRVHCSAPADYSEDKELERIIRARVDIVAAHGNLNRLLA